MLRNRVIPVLLMRDRGLIKTVKFGDAKYVGDPINAIRIFNEKEVDELVLLDVSRGAQGLGPDYEVVRDVASECFMPLAYGGGVTSVKHAAQLFRLGVEKVVVRSEAARDISIVKRLADFGGSQSVAVSVDIERGRLGKRRLFSPGTPMHKSAEWLGYIEKAVESGAGEIIVQSVDRDGTMSGLDLELVSIVGRAVDVPTIAAGGVGSLKDIQAGVRAGASAIGVGSFFVFHGPRRAVLITYPPYEELEALVGPSEDR